MTPPPERRSYDHELGVLSAKVEGLEEWTRKFSEDFKDLSLDVRHIRSALDQQRGGWRALAAVGALAGGAGALLAKFLPPFK